MTPSQQLINMIVFVITFFLARIVFGPYSWYLHCKHLYEDPLAYECNPPGFRHVIFITGLFFNILNCYWFYKILKKLQRKLNGKEKIKSTNEMSSSTNNGTKKKSHKESITIRSGGSPGRKTLKERD